MTKPTTPPLQVVQRLQINLSRRLSNVEGVIIGPHPCNETPTHFENNVIIDVSAVRHFTRRQRRLVYVTMIDAGTKPTLSNTDLDGERDL